MNVEESEKLLKPQRSRLLAFIQKRIVSPEDVEDILQDVYLQAMKHVNALDAIDNLSGWLFRIARNKIIDRYRRKKAEVSMDADDENGRSLHDLLNVEPNSDWDDNTREFVMQAIQEGIDELPDAQRALFIDQVINGKTFRQISKESGESINTLLARKRYAVRFLQKRLKYLLNIIHNQ